jgi:hypothetical protein
MTQMLPYTDFAIGFIYAHFNYPGYFHVYTEFSENIVYSFHPTTVMGIREICK